MLQFFRKIRKSLIDSGSAQKYMLYALGEILLVVIGILIALQINNWNIERQDRKEELEILKDLQRDFRANLSYTQDQLGRQKLIVEKSDSLLFNFIKRPLLKERFNDLDSLLSWVLFQPTFDPNQGNIDQLIFSGKINLIQKREIQEILTNWSAWINDTKELESWILHDVRQLEEYLHTRYSSSDILRTFSIRRNAIKYPNNFSFDREIILNDFNFENHILQIRFNRISHIFSLRRFENGILKALEILEEEITGRKLN